MLGHRTVVGYCGVQRCVTEVEIFDQYICQGPLLYYVTDFDVEPEQQKKDSNKANSQPWRTSQSAIRAGQVFVQA